MKHFLFLAALLCCGCQHAKRVSDAHTDTNAPLVFNVSFPATARSEPATGRLLLFFSTKSDEPRRSMNWFDFDPVYAIDLTNAAPGSNIEIKAGRFRGPAALAYPKPLADLPPGAYNVQALLDLDRTERDWNTGPGNLYSASVPCVLKESNGGTYDLELSNVVQPGQPPATNEWVDLFEIKSKKLSAFHGRDIFLRAGIVLPPDYHKTNQRFPVVYQVPGFSGRHTSAWGFIGSARGKRWKNGEDPVKALLVTLDPDVPLGHSVFANSDNNGPVGDALVEEFIPALEAHYRVIAEPAARVVTGHSSGGWSSLWLQIAYPDFFGGCWSTAPDPVDFRHFQTVNIYEDRNGHWSPDGHPRALARNQHEVLQTFARFNHWEYVTGLGGQLDSFNAVFSERGADGRPREIMNKLSGAIDRSVAESWKRYDIRLILEQNWPTLGTKLKGKLHVICADWDNFYLDPAGRDLAEFLDRTDHGGYVQFAPGDHGTMNTEELRNRIRQEIAQNFQKFSEGGGAEELFVAAAFTPTNSFTEGIEGPACDRNGNVFAVNFAQQQTIGRTDPSGATEVFVTLPGESVGNGIVFNRQGTMFVADYTGHNVLRIEPDSRRIEVFAHNDRMNQPNDLAIAPDETLYASDPNWKTGAGQIWRIDTNGQTKLLATNLGTSNGIEVSPDGQTLYANESVQRNIWAWTITAEKTLTNKRLIRQFPDFGFDGMRCDIDGNLYITRHGKGTVVKMSPSGEILREIDVLGSKPSNLCFGGPDGRTVYVTEVEHRRLVRFRADRPGLAWRR